MNDSIRAVGYIRVSQEKQAKNGYSLDAQEAEIKKHCEYKGWQLVEVYREAGVSGYKKDRPALDRLLKDAKEHGFQTVVFPAIDRSGRSVIDVYEIDKFLHEQGVNTVFLREGVDTSTPVGALFRNIMASIAEFEGRLIHERLLKGKRAKAAKGGYIGGWLPYGYHLEGKNIVEVKVETRIIKLIRLWRSRGKTLRWICRQLNYRQIKTQRGGQWQVSTVRAILKSANKSR